MPTIESKKYGHTQFVDVETWNNFKKLGKDRYFKIVDDSDLRETVIPAPESITDFRVELPEKPIEVEKIPDREEIKQWLTDNDIEFNSKASTDSLYKKYLDNQ